MQLQTPYGQKSGSQSLQPLINTLLLNASFIDNIGLMHGKMGISVYFFHLARSTRNKVYDEYAGELIDEIYEETTVNTPVNFENGLAGIGWGIEYLVQNGFIEADTDEVLGDFDDRISKELIYNPPEDTGLLMGILGIGAYFFKRLQNPSSTEENNTTSVKQQTLEHILDILDEKIQNTDELVKEPIYFQTLKHPNTETSKQTQTFSEKLQQQNIHNKFFDITWDYPALLWFLAEAYNQTIFNYKLRKLLPRLIEPLSRGTNLPGLCSNRLLLAVALSKLHQTTNYERGTTNENHLYIDTIISNLLRNIDRNTINTEFIPNDATLRHGTSGIGWIYSQLHHLRGGIYFKQEMEYWRKEAPLAQGVNKINHEPKAGSAHGFGILEGLAGILFTLK